MTDLAAAAETAFLDRQREAWRHPPVDDIGYLDSAMLLGQSDDDLRYLMNVMRQVRNKGWRNHDGKLRSIMTGPGGLDVLDFGCGTGIEALEQAMAGNRVSVADLPEANVELAERVLAVHGFRAQACYVAGGAPPFIDCPDAAFDEFTAVGVIHHIPWAEQIMAMAHRILRPGGRARLILYSDLGAQIAERERPGEMTAFFDDVGEYADFYNRERLESRFGRWFAIERCEYFTPDLRLLGAVLVRKDGPAP